MPGSYVRKTLKTRFSSRMAGTKMEAIHVHLALGTIRELYDRAIYTLLGFAIGLLSFLFAEFMTRENFKHRLPKVPLLL